MRRPGKPGRVAGTPLLIVLAMAQFMVVLDISIVNVALPNMQRDLHMSQNGLGWVLNAYTLTFAGFLLLGGRAADLWGRRRLFLIGVAYAGWYVFAMEPPKISRAEARREAKKAARR